MSASVERQVRKRTGKVGVSLIMLPLKISNNYTAGPLELCKLVARLVIRAPSDWCNPDGHGVGWPDLAAGWLNVCLEGEV